MGRKQQTTPEGWSQTRTKILGPPFGSSWRPSLARLPDGARRRDVRAVPALLQAKAVLAPGIKDLKRFWMFRKAAVEALWSIEHRKGAQRRFQVSIST